MKRLVWLDPGNPAQPFPDPEQALSEPNGLLAAGGCLEPRRLLLAYSRGIFPWYDAETPILWWSPDPRTVLFPEALHLSRSLRKTLRRSRFSCSLDRRFDAVIAQCGAPRSYSVDTWITPEMRTAYRQLHTLGFAHSVEVWQADQLVGGLYGVALGRVFFGESMFSRVSDASKVALACLCAHLQHWRFAAIDCQLPTAHLHRLGAIDVPRQAFLRLLEGCRQTPDASPGPWPYRSDWSALLGL